VALVSVYDDASTAVFCFGVPVAVGYLTKTGEYSEGQLLAGVRRFGLIMLGLSLPIAYLSVVGPLSSVGTSAQWLSFFLIGLSPIISLLGVSARQVMVTRGDLAGMRTTTLIAAMLRTVILTVTYFTHTLNIATAVVAVSYSGYLATLYCLYRTKIKLEYPAAPLKPILTYGLKAFPSTIGSLANGRVDQLVIAPFLSAHDVGLYAIALTVNSVSGQLGNSIGYDAFASVDHGKDQRAKAGRPVGQSLVGLSLLGLVTIAFAAVGGIGLIYGGNYAAAGLTTILLVPGSIASSVGSVMGPVGFAIGKPVIGSSSQFVSLAGVVTFIPAGIALDGFTGAAIGSSAAYAVGTLASGWWLHREGVRGMLPTYGDLTMIAKRLRATSQALARLVLRRARL
jgi:O-antigen/teichoic acid export membrane protein